MCVVNWVVSWLVGSFAYLIRVCAMCLIHLCVHASFMFVWHTLFMCVWHASFMCVWQDWVIYEAWLIHLCVTWPFMCVTWLIHICRMWRIHMRDMTHASCVLQDWYMCKALVTCATLKGLRCTVWGFGFMVKGLGCKTDTFARLDWNMQC